MKKKRGRPKTKGPKKTYHLVAVVDRDDMRKVKRYAKDSKLSVGEVIRRALSNFVA